VAREILKRALMSSVGSSFTKGNDLPTEQWAGQCRAIAWTGPSPSVADGSGLPVHSVRVPRDPSHRMGYRSSTLVPSCQRSQRLKYQPEVHNVKVTARGKLSERDRKMVEEGATRDLRFTIFSVAVSRSRTTCRYES
jgi:hypothetical protein